MKFYSFAASFLHIYTESRACIVLIWKYFTFKKIDVGVF